MVKNLKADQLMTCIVIIKLAGDFTILSSSALLSKLNSYTTHRQFRGKLNLKNKKLRDNSKEIPLESHAHCLILVSVLHSPVS